MAKLFLTLDESNPGAALDGLDIPASLRTSLREKEADASERIGTWRTRLRADKGLQLLGHPRRWPSAAAELAQAEADHEDVREIMLGLAIAAVLLHDEELAEKRDTAGDAHRAKFKAVLWSLDAGGVTVAP
jgi:hypothetical protein